MEWTKRLGLLSILAALALLGVPSAAIGEEPEPVVIFEEPDVRNLIGPDAEPLRLQATDPLSLLPRIDTLREHSLGEDVIDVWVCELSQTPQEIMSVFEDQIEPWFITHSRGRYRPMFMSKGEGCIEDAVDGASAGANGAVIVGNYAGGQAQILTCGNGPCAGHETFPVNHRYAFVGVSHLGSTAVHEIGHMIRWMHSYSGQSSSQYDNPADVMSGNYGIDQYGGAGSYSTPYATAAINRYGAGWIDPDEVAVVDGDRTLTLTTADGNGLQMAIVRDGDSFYALDARVPGPHDAIPEVWSGVAIYRVTAEPNSLPGFRRISQYPAVGFNPGDFAAYEEPLDSVLQPGDSMTLSGIQVAVTASVENGYQVRFGEGHDGIFVDDDGSTFESDIEWLAEAGITLGCNPPINDRFCPNDIVTRGQMAAFLHRALDDVLVPTQAVEFIDDNGNTFENDIEWLGGTGVTRGCNPPANDRYCPDDNVTRGQMAAFLVRALSYVDNGGGDLFGDDDGNTFEKDIDKLGTAGVTRGCNPPSNDRFCPDDFVTRGQMAAFLHRALGG